MIVTVEARDFISRWATHNTVVTRTTQYNHIGGYIANINIWSFSRSSCINQPNSGLIYFSTQHYFIGTSTRQREGLNWCHICEITIFQVCIIGNFNRVIAYTTVNYVSRIKMCSGKLERVTSLSTVQDVLARARFDDIRIVWASDLIISGTSYRLPAWVAAPKIEYAGIIITCDCYRIDTCIFSICTQVEINTTTSNNFEYNTLNTTDGVLFSIICSVK